MMDEKDMAEQAYKNGYNKAVGEIAQKYYWRMKMIIECWQGNIKKHIYEDLVDQNKYLLEEILENDNL